MINAGYSDWAIAGDYIIYKDYSSAVTAPLTPPMFYADYSLEVLADGAPAGEKLTDSWFSYFGVKLLLKDILALSNPKYSWTDMNDMYSYA